MFPQTDFRSNTTVFFDHTFRVLLLEDCEFDRLRFSRMAKKSNILLDITTVTNLSELAVAADKATFNLVVLDYFLPQGTAVNAVEMLRNSDCNQDAKPIILSGNLDPKIALKSYRMGCGGYYEKAQLSTDLLVELIEKQKEKAVRKSNASVSQIPYGTQMGIEWLNALRPNSPV
ncbi:response regulator [Algirhabdus cladophorae]|uniref:response regulator n=1 Tax=Algirhabdus cladophorae TaxID=3377108 RepID=UPI003B849879